MSDEYLPWGPSSTKNQSILLDASHEERSHSLEVCDGYLLIYSSCCSNNISKEKAIEIRDFINNWLEGHQE